MADCFDSGRQECDEVILSDAESSISIQGCFVQLDFSSKIDSARFTPQAALALAEMLVGAVAVINSRN